MINSLRFIFKKIFNKELKYRIKIVKAIRGFESDYKEMDELVVEEMNDKTALEAEYQRLQSKYLRILSLTQRYLKFKKINSKWTC